MIEQLELARKELLDFSLRNRLINYRNSVSRTIEVIDEKSIEIFDILVNSGISMTFESSEIVEDEKFNESGDNYLFGQPKEKILDESKYTDSILQTKHTDVQLQKRLRSISSFAKSSLEEQGVNLLYLALGFLKWYESDNSEIERFAPLILIPVTLDRTSIRSKFRVQFNGEEPGVNISLLEKLRSEHDIKIDSLELNERETINSFYSTVRDSTSHLDRWEVIEDDIRLGFFSFSKFLMYNDLNAENWDDDNKPFDHPILSKLLGYGFDNSSPFNNTDFEGEVDYEDLYHVLESDSSQQEVILSIREGHNMVVQGPPGTGKSQTIANIISDFIARGKKVLFVAEKMAALNVVKSRLDSLGIGEIALELHSNKAKKKEFLEKLKSTLDIHKPQSPYQNDEFLKDAETTKKILNDYASVINKPIDGNGFTPIQTFGYYLNALENVGKDNLPNINLDNVEIGDKEDYYTKLNIVKEVKLALEKTGSKSINPFNGIENREFDFYSSKEWIDGVIEVFASYKETSEKISNQIKNWNSFTLNGSKKSFELLVTALELLSEQPIHDKVNYQTENLNDINKLDDYINAVKGFLEFNKLFKSWKDRCFEQTWDQNVLNLRGILQGYSTKWYRIIIPKYRTAVNTVRSWTKESNLTDKEALELVDLILLYQESHKKWSKYTIELKEIFGDCNSISEVPKIWLDILEWVKKASLLVQKNSFYTPIINEKKVDSAQVIDIRDIVENYNTLNIKFNDLLKTAEHNQSFTLSSETEIQDILNKLEDWILNKDGIQDYIQLLKNIDRFEHENLSWLKNIVDDWEFADSRLVDVFKYFWFTQLSRKVFQENEILNLFDGENHHQLIKNFISFEKDSLRFNSYRVIEKHYSNLPNTGGISVGTLGLLKAEFQRKRKIKPIRTLLNDCGQVIQDIKPLFMMSPMSIAQYLPQNKVEFDLVLFDEASQIKPVEGFGAVLRGKQVVVVGDSKQLPPTSFFDNDIDFEEEEDFNDDSVKTSDVESILTLFAAKQAPENMLRWHYRSKHESLIAVNNHEFYNSNLFVFPTAYQEDQKRGLQFKYLPNTIYVAGKGGRKNKGEAEAVVESIIEHAKKYPNLTLGVAAFSQTQARLIEDVLESKLLQNNLQAVEEFINTSHPSEPFFIKNLENVQGDERDVIFISVGYGKQENGKFSINFGPINKDGGERRLNVLFSRAKQQCVIFSNFKSDELDLSKTQSVGVRALKTFLQYAENRVLSVPDVGDATSESPFEEQVANTIINHGYEIVHQVGSAGFRIDIGVKHPTEKGRFILAVECDGASYHSSKIARDRDKTRQLVLEAQGWVFHRIWSTDWFYNVKRETERLIAAIEYHSKNQRKKTIKKETSKVQLTRVETKVLEDNMEKDLSVPYKKSDLVLNLADELYEFAPSQFAGWILQIVEVEQPVHKDVILTRILEASGVTRKGKRIIESFNYGVDYAVEELNLKDNSDFLSLDDDAISIRDRTDLNRKERKVEFLPPAEVKHAISLILKNSYGANFSDIEVSVLDLFGFKKKNEGSNILITTCLQDLLSESKLVLKDSIFSLSN